MEKKSWIWSHEEWKVTTISSLGGSCYFPSDTKNIDREAAGMEEVCEDTVCIQFLWTFRTSVVGSQLTQRLRRGIVGWRRAYGNCYCSDASWNLKRQLHPPRKSEKSKQSGVRTEFIGNTNVIGMGHWQTTFGKAENPENAVWLQANSRGSCRHTVLTNQYSSVLKLLW